MDLFTYDVYDSETEKLMDGQTHNQSSIGGRDVEILFEDLWSEGTEPWHEEQLRPGAEVEKVEGRVLHLSRKARQQSV